MTSRLGNGAASAAEPRSTLLIPFVLTCAVLGARAQINVSTGGQGTLRLMAIVVPLVAIVTVIRYGSKRSLGFMANPVFVLAVLPYLALTGLLPILGVMFHRFPERTLLSSIEATTVLGFLVIGAAISSERRSWAPWLMLAIAAQLIYAAGQAIFLLGGPGAELFTPFHDWDLSLNRQLVRSRSSGLYLNPNELGLWAGVAVILSWAMLSPRLRVVGITLALLTLLLSQSRGAAVALVAALVVGTALSAGRPRMSAGAFKTALTFGFGGLLAVLVAFAVTPSGALEDRFGAVFDVLSEGPGGDANLSGRLDLWSGVIVLNSVYPFGTWGSPELVLGTSIDSSWFRAFAQGSVPYLATLVLLTVASLAVGEPRDRHALRLCTVLVAIAGVTQIPFGYPVIAVFWVLLGAALQSSVVGRGSDQQPVPGQPTPTRRVNTAGASLRVR